MSVVPLEDSSYANKKRASASDQLGGGVGVNQGPVPPYYDTMYEETKRGAHGQYVRSTAKHNSAVAERDARVKDKLGKKTDKSGKTAGAGGGNTKQSAGKSAPPAADEKEVPIVITEVDVPLMWTFDAKNQKIAPQKLEPYLKQHGIEGDISIVSAAGRHSDMTVHSPMALTLVGAEEKGKPVIKGRDKDGNGYTTIVPRHSKHYDGAGDKLYERKNGDFDPADFADHMDVDVTRLRSDITPYFGKGGQLSKSHVEVHKGKNEQLYKLLTDSTGVESAFHGGDKDNPSIVVSRADHKRVVDKYLTDGGYKRANRVKPDQVEVYLHHIGTAYNSHVTDSDVWTPATNLAGMTLSEKKELSQPTASHRVMYEMRLQVAHKPKQAGDDLDDDGSE